MLRVQGAAIIIKNPDGKVLLNLRDERAIPFPNCWTLPGGRVEVGETPQQAGIRELHEETGLQLPLSFWKVYERQYPDENIVVEQHVFVGAVDHTNPPLVVGEGQALQFFGKDEIFPLVVGFGFGELLAEFFASEREKRGVEGFFIATE